MPFLRRTLQRPSNFGGGIQRINWNHQISRGLHYLRVFDTLSNTPLFTKGGTDGAFTNTGTMKIVPADGGQGLSGNGTSAAFMSTSNNYQVPVNNGTCLVYVKASFNAADGVWHPVFSIGDDGLNFFGLTTFTDNNIYFGWETGGVSYRAIVASSGFWSAGDSFVMGGPWYSTNVDLWVKGVKRGSLGSAPNATAPTQPANFRVNNINTDNASWGGTGAYGTGAIYYIAIWDRRLSDSEIRLVSSDPWIFMNSSSPNPVMPSVAAASSVVFRKTLSRVGTRTGSRQTHIG